MPQLKYSEAFKLEIVQYMQSGHSIDQASKVYVVDKESIRKWVSAYKYHGVEGLLIKQHNRNKYTGDFKKSVIEYMQQNSLSQKQTAALFNIPSHRSIASWESKYLKEGPAALFIETRGKAGYKTGVMKGQKPTFSKKEKGESLLEENRRLRMENEYLKKLNALIQEREECEKPTK